MKKVILTLLVATSLVACKKEVIEIPESIISTADYVGCWETEKTGTYDIMLAELDNEYLFNFGTNCNPTTGVLNGGFFRNDTLIFDNGYAEYWLKIDGDTLSYSTYQKMSNKTPIKFTKIN